MAEHDLVYPRKFTSGITKFETDDKVHADTYNPVINTLINNEVYIKEELDESVKTSKEHIENDDLHVTAELTKKWSAETKKSSEHLANDDLHVTADDKIKLKNIEEGAEANQNAISNIKAGSITITANGETATIELVPGTNITISADNSTKKITINAPESIKNPNALAIQVNGATIASYDGSSAKTVNIESVNNAASAAKLTNTRTVTLSGVVATAQSFNGESNLTIPVTAVPASLLTGTVPVGVLATNSTDYTTSRLRNISASTAAVTSLANGAIHLQYEA